MATKPYVDMLPEVDTPRVSKLGHGKLGCLRVFDKNSPVVGNEVKPRPKISRGFVCAGSFRRLRVFQ
jgi:hypothetical protein